MLSQIYPFVSTFKHNEIQNNFSEEYPSQNKIETSIFFDERKCGSLHMLSCMLHFL